MKKFRSNWFRVAVEGATTDGRQIERSWIEDMAATYDRAKYGARIWMEHYRSALPDSPFRAYGDVLAAKAEEVEIDGQKRLALFAQIEPTDDLVNMVNKLKQKIFTSIEITPKFADSGRAYLSGLAVTDSPASIGTEMLAFAQQHPDASPLKGRKQHADALFSVATETLLEFEEIEDKPGIGAALFARVQELLKGGKEKTDGEFAQVGQAVEAIAEHVKQQAEAFAVEQQTTAALRAELNQVKADFTELKARLGTTQDHKQTQRPTATGGTDRIETDC
ncbi:Phage capsid scaffolding protein (GPO) serine peptidase [Azotobacter beijerinckii]|uniref:Phage capsid scaffolding protein (GPO) serine peptidase n=1 Tax=Azotobacter beijerinckii TaxID=170623 RepID=A0A1H9MQW1_9GAMM|nr:GPO family capsid scaffolding protein [Azotobacter beijerinckii]SER25971.1 Phage capsid scaffolding protein (GPO) serine peptidase [Azotobacter beijerinckii]